MDLSFVIVNWNTRGALLNCLASVVQSVAQPTRYEMFVVDNGSTDGSVGLVRRLYPDAILIENSSNVGFARANNQALRLAQGKFIVLLNTDARLNSQALSTLVDYLNAHAETAIVGGQLINPDGTRQNSFSVFPSLWTELLNKSLLKILLPWWFPGKLSRFRGPAEVDSLIGACMVIRADAIKDIGLMDEAFFLFFEETDWCLRFRKAGWEIAFVPGAQIVHAQGRSVDQDKKNAALEYYRSRYLYFKKHKSGLELVILYIGLWGKLLANVLWAGLMCLVTAGRMREFSQRLGTLAYILAWHLRGCPRWPGLAKSPLRPNLLAMSDGKVQISACLITHNEEKNVRDCLASLQFVSEIVVIDSFSTDQTPWIAREYTDKVYQTEWSGFSATKNLCVEQAANEWVLVIDADERVTQELRAEILDLKDDADGYFVPRRNFFLGKWIRHCGWYPDYTLRLFRKGVGRFKDRTVHESVALQGKSGILRNPLLHYTYRDLAGYVTRLNRYSTLAAEQMRADMGDGRAGSRLLRVKLLLDIVTRPAFTFAKIYLFQLGFLDGFHGLLLAANHSYYVMTKYAKLWESLRQTPQTETPSAGATPGNPEKIAAKQPARV